MADQGSKSLAPAALAGAGAVGDLVIWVVEVDVPDVPKLLGAPENPG